MEEKEMKDNDEMEEPVVPDEIDDEEELDDDEESEDLSVAEKVIGVFVSPKSTFKYLAGRPDFWSAFIILSLLMIALSMLLIKYQMPLMMDQTLERTQESLAAANLSDEEMSTALSQTQKFLPYLFYGGAVLNPPIMLLITWLLTTVGVFFIGLMQGLKTDFKKLFGVIPWLSLISMLPVQIISTIIVASGKLTEAADMTNWRLMKPISLISLVPKSVELPGAVGGMLAAIDPFFIWSMIVMVIALEYANECKRSQAIITTVIIAILGIILSGLMSGMAAMSQAG